MLFRFRVLGSGFLGASVSHLPQGLWCSCPDMLRICVALEMETKNRHPFKTVSVATLDTRGVLGAKAPKA